MINEGTNFTSSFEIEPNTRVIFTDDNGIALVAIKTTTGAPSTIADQWQSSCEVFNTFDGGIYVNIGTLAVPNWKLITAGGGGSQTLSQTLALGNRSGTYDISMDSGQKIKSSTSTGYINMDDGGAGDATVIYNENGIILNDAGLGTSIVSGFLILGTPLISNGLIQSYDNSSNKVFTLYCPNAMANSIDWRLPNLQGGAGTVLSNDGSGNLSWVAGGGGEDLATTLGIGNTTGGTDIAMTTGDSLVDTTDTGNYIKLYNGLGNMELCTDKAEIHAVSSAFFVDAGNLYLGTSNATAGQITMFDFSSVFHWNLYAPSGLAGQVDWYLPNVQGGAGTALTNDGSGNLSWISYLTGIDDYTTFYNLFAGSTAGISNTTGTNNTAIGTSALSSNTIGSANTALGYWALTVNGAGSSNTAVGSSSLLSNIADNNTAVGYNSLTANNTGTGCAAMGSQALMTNTTGTFNTAIGFLSMLMNDSGDNNTAVGANSLYANGEVGHFAAGFSNTALGYSSMYLNTNGNQNTATGYNSLYSNGSGGNNVANGFEALRSNTSGGDNTAVGANALYTNATNNYNSAFGFNSLQSSTGDYNTGIGYNAIVTATFNNGTAIGANSLVSKDNAVVLGQIGGMVETNVGIGTATPDDTAMLDIVSVDRGVLVPRMTTTQKNAIVTPAIGLEVYDTDLLKKSVFNGTTWKNAVDTFTGAQANGTQWSGVKIIRLYHGAITGTPVAGATLLQAMSGANANVVSLGAGFFVIDTYLGVFTTSDLVTGTNPDTTTFTFTPPEFPSDAFTLTTPSAWLYYAVGDATALTQTGPANPLIAKQFRQTSAAVVETLNSEAYTNFNCGYVGLPTGTLS